MTPIASTGASTTSRIACSSSKASVLKSGATALLSIAALLLSATSAQAATYYWDEDQATAGFGIAAGAWAAPTVDKWSLDATGLSTAEASYTTVNGDSLYFGTDTVALGSGTIAVTGTVTATQLLFGKVSGAITLGAVDTDATINLRGGAPQIWAASAAGTASSPHTINANLNSNSNVNIGRQNTASEIYIINGDISGAFNLNMRVKNFTSYVALDGDNSSFNGNIAQVTGSLKFDQNLGSGTNLTLAGNGGQTNHVWYSGSVAYVMGRNLVLAQGNSVLSSPLAPLTIGNITANDSAADVSPLQLTGSAGGAPNFNVVAGTISGAGGDPLNLSVTSVQPNIPGAPISDGRWQLAGTGSAFTGNVQVDVNNVLEITGDVAVTGKLLGVGTYNVNGGSLSLIASQSQTITQAGTINISNGGTFTTTNTGATWPRVTLNIIGSGNTVQGDGWNYAGAANQGSINFIADATGVSPVVMTAGTFQCGRTSDDQRCTISADGTNYAGGTADFTLVQGTITVLDTLDTVVTGFDPLVYTATITATGGGIVLSVVNIAEETPIWTGAGDAVWVEGDTTNWDVSYNNGEAVSFTDAGAGTVTVSTALTPLSVLVNSSNDYTFTGLGSVTAPFTKQGTGNLTIDTTFTRSDGLPLEVTAGNVTVGSSGTFNLTNNLTLAAGSDLTVAGTLNIDGGSTDWDRIFLSATSTLTISGAVNVTTAYDPNGQKHILNEGTVNLTGSLTYTTTAGTNNRSRYDRDLNVSGPNGSFNHNADKFAFQDASATFTGSGVDSTVGGYVNAWSGSPSTINFILDESGVRVFDCGTRLSLETNTGGTNPLTVTVDKGTYAGTVATEIVLMRSTDAGAKLPETMTVTGDFSPLTASIGFGSGANATSLVLKLSAPTSNWDGGGADGNWGTVANWDGDELPPSGVNAVIFTGTAQATTTNDLVGYVANGIQFNNTVAGESFSLAGNAINLTGDITSADAAGTIDDSITLDLQLTGGDRAINTGADHNLAVSGVISEDGSARGLDKNGTGTLTLTGANTYTGATNVYAGTLAISDVASLGTAAAGTTVESPGQLSISGGITVADPLILNGTGPSNSAGALLSDGANTVSGQITINNGGVRINTADGSAPLTVTGGVVDAGTSSGDSTFAGNFVFNSAIDVGDFNIRVAGSGTAGQGTANDFLLNTTGNVWGNATVFFDGSVKLGVSDAIAATSTMVFGWTAPEFSTSKLDLNGFDQTLASIATTDVTDDGSNMSITDSTGTGTLTLNQATDTTYTGRFDGAMNLVKAGVGTLTLNNRSSAAHSISGTTTVSAGILDIDTDDYTSAITVAAAGALEVDLGTTLALQAALSVDAASQIVIVGTPTLASYTLISATSIAGTPVLSAPIANYVLEVSGNELQLNLDSQVWNGAGDRVWADGDATNWDGSYNNGAPVSFTDAGAGTVTVSTALTPLSVFVDSTAGYTFTGAGSITAPFSKQGAGNLTIATTLNSSAAITLDGGTTTINGAVSATISGGGSLSTGSSALIIDGGSFNMLTDGAVQTGLFIGNDTTLRNGGTITSGARFGMATGKTLVIEGGSGAAVTATNSVAITNVSTYRYVFDATGVAYLQAGTYASLSEASIEVDLTNFTGWGSIATFPLVASSNISALPAGVSSPVEAPAGFTITAPGKTYGVDYTINVSTTTNVCEVAILEVATNDVASWAAGFTASDASFTGSPATDPLTDYDNDGLSNLLEYVLGGSPIANQDTAVPTVSQDATHMIFTYNRSDISTATGNDVTIKAEYAADLSGSWTEAVNGTASVVIEEDTSADPDVVTVKVPLAGTEQFIRLNVVTGQ